jgi:type IV pilus assembly protein PilM
MEVGADAIRAIRLERDGDSVSVTDFAVIPHKKVLTTPDLDQNEMIRLGLGQFVAQKSLEGERLLMSVPGHAAFARFAKLPPVDQKKIPDIVKFEAVQQIPFPIDQVEWDYQTFVSKDSPDVEVGIFAITRERVSQRLSLYGELGIQPEVLTLSPVAVYNAMAYDLGLEGEHKPLVFVDIGTSATDLIVADQGRCWIRTFPLGGTHFTDAVAEAFKLSYGKADKLKQESATSKYAKQIMQAMRPVFSDLLQEVQRSLGYYQSLHRERTLETIIGVGSTFKIPGLRKFLGQQLQMDVLRLDEFKRIRLDGRDAAEFSAHTVNLATAYGLALQGLGLAPISVNLAPVNALREKLWKGKTKWFAGIAATAVLASGAMFIRPYLDASSLQHGGVPSVVTDVTRRGDQLKREYQTLESQSAISTTAETLRGLADDRSVWTYLLHDAMGALLAAQPQPALLGDDPAAVLAIPAGERNLVQLRDLQGSYDFADGKRRIDVVMEVEFTNVGRERFLNDRVATWLRETARQERPDVPFRIDESSISINTARMVTVRVPPDGASPDAGGGAGGGPGGGAGAGPGGGPGAGPGGGFRPPPPRGGEELAPPGAPSLGGGGGSRPPGRREGGGDQIAPPGSDLGPRGGRDAGSGGGTFAPGGGGSSGGLVPPSAPVGDRPPGGGEAKTVELDKVAPIPTPPKLLKPGDEIHRAWITFSVELIGPARPAAPVEESTSA